MKYEAHSTQTIPLPVIAVSTNELELRQALARKDAQIDRLINEQAVLKELVQLLRDEIAILKGQNPKPKIEPSQLEGSKKKKIGIIDFDGILRMQNLFYSILGCYFL